MTPKPPKFGALRTGRTPSFKPSMRETLAANNAADKYYAASFGKEPQAQSEIALKRQIVNHSDEDDLEAAVLSEVELMLVDHPAVLIAVRQNSGSAFNAVGVPVTFWRWMRRPTPKEPMLLPDIWGLLTDGAYFAIECKKRAWLFNPNDEREVKQRRFLNLVARHGGRAGFASSVGQARSIIES